MPRNARSTVEARVVTFANADKGNRVVRWRTRTRTGTRDFKWSSDFGLGVAGIGAAMASAAFAVIMMNANINDPKFGGSEYLLLFTRPLQPVDSPIQQLATRGQDPGIDYTATGSIGPIRPAAPSAISGSSQPLDSASVPVPEAKLPLKDYVVKSVRGGVAIIKGPKGVFVAEAGTLLPNGDTVASIDRHAGHWVVVTSGGLIEDQ